MASSRVTYGVVLLERFVARSVRPSHCTLEVPRRLVSTIRQFPDESCHTFGTAGFEGVVSPSFASPAPPSQLAFAGAAVISTSLATTGRLRDLDLGVVNQFDTKRLEVVVGGLPLFQGAQLSIDTTLVCPPTQAGEAKQVRP